MKKIQYLVPFFIVSILCSILFSKTRENEGDLVFFISSIIVQGLAYSFSEKFCYFILGFFRNLGGDKENKIKYAHYYFSTSLFITLLIFLAIEIDTRYKYRIDKCNKYQNQEFKDCVNEISIFNYESSSDY